MKRLKITLLLMGMIYGLCAQETTTEKIVIPLSKPGARGTLEIGQVNGNIIIDGYDGKEVLVTATIPPSKERPIIQGYDGDDEDDEAPAGMKRISGNPIELSAEERNNKVEVSTQSWIRRTDLSIKLPSNFDLQVSTVHGILEVNNVSGRLEVSNVNGPVSLDGVSGSVIGNTVNGDMKVRFVKVEPDQPMSFVTLNGDVDVTLPASTKATTKMKSDRGDIFSDFDMPTETAREEIKGDDDENYSIRINSYIKGKINGGGPEFTFKNMNGNIIIRKGN